MKRTILKKAHFLWLRSTAILFTLLLLGGQSWGQPWTYDFGTGTGTHTSATASTTFLPTPSSGTARVRVGTNPGSIAMVNPGITLGGATELQITSNTGSASTTKFSVYDYTASKLGYIKFHIAFNGGTNGVYQLTIGDGATFSDNNAMANSQVFAGVQWSLGASNAITYRVLNAGTWGATNINNSTTLFTQSTSNDYLVEIYYNNTSASADYSRSGTNTLTTAKWDLWVNGTKVNSALLPTGGLGSNVNIDSYAFNHQVSATAPGILYLDDIEYSNTLPTGAASPPTLSADATNNDVDNSIDITFTDNATWRAAVTAVKIGGSTLTVTNDYVLSSGNLQLKPSGLNALLTTSGTKSVTVEATGYSDASVSQVINPGTATKLAMKTQPAAPATNGAVLTTQPAVYIQDQYGNTTTSTASVLAAVGAGSWTLGGTTSVAGISGTVTYSGLTATSASAVTGATIAFSSIGLTGVTSGTFNIPAPPVDYISLIALGTPVSENFNGMGTGTSAPSGFGIQDGNTTTVTSTLGAQASSGSPSTGASYNWGQNASERAIGLMFSGGYSSKSVIVKVRNNTGSTVNSFTISFDYEQYRSNTSTQTFKLQYSTSLTSGWTDVAGGNFVNIVSGTSTYGYATLIASQTITNLVYVPIASVSNGTDVYFRWILDGSSSSSGVGVDNFSISGAMLSSPPALTAAAGATVDGAFNVTFSDNAAWRSAITGIKVGATTLTAGYSVSSGQITFTPSASVPVALLQTAATSTITVEATGYSNATVSQTIGAGAATKLGMKTQPAAPASNGAVLATQPAVYIQDQYGNTTTSTASVVAVVGSGSWTLGGTNSVAGISGTVTYSGLTATSASAVTGATIAFSSVGLTGVASETFNIPAPPAENDLCSGAQVIPASGPFPFLTTIVDNSSATTTGDPIPTCQPDFGHSIWYSFTPTVSGSYSFSTCSAETSTTIDDDVLSLYSGSCGALTNIICNDDYGISCTGKLASLSSDLTAGTTYYIMVSGYSTSVGDIQIKVKAPLSAPVATSATTILQDGFTANWDAVTNAESYRLDVSTSPTFGIITNATDLFISEYVEGSSNNKYIEIYNGTGASVDLSNYRLHLFNNGNLIPNQDILLSGTLINNFTIVYKHSSATIFSGSATSSGACTFNGNDAIALYKMPTGSYVDIFGRIGEDPGTAWTSGAFTTVDKTLVRKPSVTGGVTTNPSSGFPTLSTEWEQYDIDDISNLGVHIYLTPDFVTGYNNLSVSGTSQLVTGLASNTTYYYRVRAYSANTTTTTSVNSNVITVTTAAAATSTFTGTGHWNEAIRWDNGVPASTTNAFINGNCTLTEAGTCSNLVINPTGALRVNPSQTLNITGQFLIKSSAAGTGSYINNGSVTYALTPKVERYISQACWHYITAPVQGAVSGVWQNLYLKDYNEATNAFNALIVPTTVPMTVGKGFAIWSSAGSTGNVTRTYTGNLNEGDKIISLQWSGANRGNNLIGNVFTSAISADIHTWTKTNVNNSLWVWNPSGGNYLTYNGTGGTLPGGIIPASQGFLVKANNTGASITIMQDKRTYSPSGFFKDQPMNNLMITASGNNYSDGLVVYFNNNATNDYDSDYDVEKYNGLPAAPQISTLWSGMKLSINVIPDITEYTVMPMSFNCNVSGNYTITAEGASTFNPDLSVKLQDLFSGEIIDLREESVYQFTHVYDSLFTGYRFNLIFGESITSIAENSSGLNIYSYTNKIILLNPTFVKVAQIDVYNSMGQLVKRLNSPETTDRMEIETGFAMGNYIVKVIAENGNIMVQKLIIGY